MNERLLKLISNDDLAKIRNTSVLIIGIGGVGGYAVEALARMGIGTLIIADNDIISKSNLNRQIIALNSTIGKYKVDVMKERINDINPECNVVKHNLFLDSTTIDCIFTQKIDYVIDACDTVTSKLLLIEMCNQKNIPLISCMGTGNKFDPTKLKITDINKTSYDPLCKVIRYELRKRQFKGKVPVIYSDEIPIKTGDNIPGSTSLVPSVAGIHSASYIINLILQKN